MPKRCAAIVLCFLSLHCPAAIGDWANDFLVHRTPSYTEDGAEGCLRCHSGEKMRAVGQGAHGDAGNPNSPAALHECETCHGEGSIHVSRAHGGRGFPPLMTFGRGQGTAPRETQLQTCLCCHESGDTGNKPIVFLGSVHDRGPINCSTCHQVHAGQDAMRDRSEQSRTCFRCHRKVKEEHPPFRGRAVNTERARCASCHDVHQPANDGEGADAE